MGSYNRIILVGNLTRDPQLQYTPQNTAVCKFGIATNRQWRDRDGNTRDETCFVDCTVFGRAAETFNQYMSKGRSCLVEGRLSLDRWTSPEGEKRSKHEVIVENFTFLGGGQRDSSRTDERQTDGSHVPSTPGATESPDGGGFGESPPAKTIPF